MPTPEQITEVKGLLIRSIKMLIQNDRNIFTGEIYETPDFTPEARILNRELHETSINHRLAHYLEHNLLYTNMCRYNVDIEYNRYYMTQKFVLMGGVQIPIRPDILIHSRMDDTINPQHYLVIEGKKHEVSEDDIGRVKALINDSRYNYLFGFTIYYCIDHNQVSGNLFYMNNGEIIDPPEPIIIPVPVQNNNH